MKNVYLRFIFLIFTFNISLARHIYSEELPHERFELSPIFNPLFITMTFLKFISESNTTEAEKIIDRNKIILDLKSRNTDLIKSFTKTELDDLFDLCLLGNKIFKVAYPIHIFENLNISLDYKNNSVEVKILIHKKTLTFLLSRIQGKESWEIVGGNYFDSICIIPEPHKN
ncbi:hypothetical protein [Leptospira noguchii]|uniref:hypothetical protein n=1 Tax=Leptospira noguchii TaxID=28182 RepID=UPI001FB64971|nr:hypothetical protein [Leptospira noguchii]UOG32736.1 hypothetical protein MAL06_20835 [Leptospira noguchii]